MKKAAITWEVISDHKSIETLYSQWNASNASNTNLFCSALWLTQWTLQYWHKSWQCHCYIAYDKTTLVAIAPFYIQPSAKWYQPTILRLLGQGEPEEAEISSEYIDIQILAGYEEIVLGELAQKIKRLQIDQILCRAILADSHLSALFQKAFNYSAIASHSRYLITRSTWSLASLSKNTRSRYKRALNQLKNINAQFCWVAPEQYEKFVTALTEYHQKRWQEKGQNGAFFHQDFRAFHQPLRNDGPTAIVKMSAIVVSGKPIAINYYLTDDTTLYFYQCGWDEANYAKLSPGMALHLWSIEHCEHPYYDFMMGGNNDSYKAKFGSAQLPMANVEIVLNKWKVTFNKVFTKLGFI
jgi:hypothetical protein